jgi:hypothetical protein
MIVDPDFFDHWKTRMVVDALGGDELAPLYIMRLWSHCQTRKGEVFDIPTSGIKAICKYAGEAKVLEDALVSADYLLREDKTVTIVGWLEKNASLVAAWSNGNLGGRPPKAKKETHGEPTDNPRVTHGKPTDNPRQTHGEPIREDKSREDIEEAQQPPVAANRSTRGTRLQEDWVLPSDWKTWAEKERPDIDVDSVAEDFRDFWIAKAGSSAVKLNWEATWRLWVRKQNAPKAQDRKQINTFAGLI